MSQAVVVVGGGLAAVRCVEALIEVSDPPQVMLVAAEARSPYDRPPLTKSYLREGGDAPQLVSADLAGVDVRAGVRATALDLTRRRVALDDGSEAPYDALVLATGGEPRRLPGLEGDGVHVLRTIEDADGLRADLVRHGRLVIIGAGFVGCEVATTAQSLGAEVTVIEAQSAPLLRPLGHRVGQLIAKMHRAAGVDLRTGAMVTRVEGQGAGRVLVLSDGSVVPAPVVLVGLGMEPSLGWLVNSGLSIEDGIVCDERGWTGAPEVWAAGDVARWRRVDGVHSHRLEHWTSAANQGRAVALSILGRPEPVDQVPYFWSDQLGVKMQMVGTAGEGDDVAVVDLGRDRLLALYGRAGVLSAAFGIGAARHIIMLKESIRDSADYASVVASIA